MKFSRHQKTRRRYSSRVLMEAVEPRLLFAASYTFTKVADSATIAPGLGFAMADLEVPAMSDEHVVFYARSADETKSGIYTNLNGPLVAVADTSMNVPGQSVKYAGFNRNPTIDGKSIVYHGIGALANDDLVGGIYRVVDGVPLPVVSYGSPIPGKPGLTINAMGNYGLHGSTVSFTAGRENIFMGVYTNANGITKIADYDTPNPAGNGNNFIGFFGDTHPDDQGVTFLGFKDPTAIFNSAGGLHMILNTDAGVPEYGGQYLSFSTAYGMDDGKISFYAQNSAQGISAIFVLDVATGTVTKLVDNTMNRPEGGTFNDLYGIVGASNGNTLFGAVGNDGNCTIYRSFNGAIARVIGPGDTLDGKTVMTVNFHPDGISGDSVAFHVTFTDEKWGIYTAPVLRGSDQIVPIAPKSQDASGFDFAAAPDNKWVDAPLASSLTFTADPGSAFTGITKLPTGYGSSFMVEVNGQTLGPFAAGASVAFPATPAPAPGINGLSAAPAAAGATTFKITGINSGVTPKGAFGFPIDLDYASALAGFSVNATGTGSIAGNIWNDVNSSGAKDAGENNLANWNAYIDSNNNGAQDLNEKTASTDASGNYKFSNLPDGTYVVKVALQAGYRKSLPISGTPGYTVALAGGSAITGKNFGVTQKLYLAGKVFNDTNSNGTQDAGEAALPDVTIKVMSNGAVITTRITDSQGAWKVQGLSAGTGEVVVVPPAGYTIAYPAVGKYAGQMNSGQGNSSLNFGLHKIAPAPAIANTSLILTSTTRSLNFLDFLESENLH